jgi:hypothetical protein
MRRRSFEVRPWHVPAWRSIGRSPARWTRLTMRRSCAAPLGTCTTSPTCNAIPSPTGSRRRRPEPPDAACSSSCWRRSSSCATPSPGHDWRAYQLLTWRYVEGLSVLAVQEKLALSKSEYYRDHQRALAAVASLLSGRRVSGRPATPTGRACARPVQAGSANQPHPSSRPTARRPTSLPASSAVSRRLRRWLICWGDRHS